VRRALRDWPFSDGTASEGAREEVGVDMVVFNAGIDTSYTKRGIFL
jgi:hypothetical protein